MVSDVPLDIAAKSSDFACNFAVSGLGHRPHGAKLPVATLVEQERLSRMFRCQRGDLSNSDKMISSLMYDMELAVYPCDDTVEDW